MKIKTLANGKIQATARMGWQQVRREESDFYRSCSRSLDAREEIYASWEASEMPTVYEPTEGAEKQINVGDVGCLRLSSSEAPRLSLYNDEDGIPGNMNADIKQLHGWRGTTNGNCVNAYGWRRVESIERLSRGVGFRVTFSADLKADDD